MTLHLIKLAVGADSVADMIDWRNERLAEKAKRGEELLLTHTTRQMPKRRDDVLAGGSLYWVVKGIVACRNRIVDLRADVDAEGIERCIICLDPETVRVDPRPRAPFQGWRYLAVNDAPPDLTSKGAGADMPDALQIELRRLGVV